MSISNCFIPHINCCFNFVQVNLTQKRFYSKYLEKVTKDWKQKHVTIPVEDNPTEDQKTGIAERKLSQIVPFFGSTHAPYIEGDLPEWDPEWEGGQWLIKKGIKLKIPIPHRRKLKEIFAKIPVPRSVEGIFFSQLDDKIKTLLPPDIEEGFVIPPEEERQLYINTYKLDYFVVDYWIYPFLMKVGNVLGIVYRPAIITPTEENPVPTGKPRLALWIKSTSGKPAQFIFDCYLFDPFRRSGCDQLKADFVATIYGHYLTRIYGTTTGQYGPYPGSPEGCLCDGGMLVVGSAPGGDLNKTEQTGMIFELETITDFHVPDFRIRVWYSLQCEDEIDEDILPLDQRPSDENKEVDLDLDVEDFCEKVDGPTLWLKNFWPDRCGFQVVEGRAQNLDAGSIAKRTEWIAPKNLLDVSGGFLFHDDTIRQVNPAGYAYVSNRLNERYVYFQSKLFSQHNVPNKQVLIYINPYHPEFPMRRKDDDSYDVMDTKILTVLGKEIYEGTLEIPHYNPRNPQVSKPESVTTEAIYEPSYLVGGRSFRGAIGPTIRFRDYPRIFGGNRYLLLDQTTIGTPVTNHLIGTGTIYTKTSHVPNVIYYHSTILTGNPSGGPYPHYWVSVANLTRTEDISEFWQIGCMRILSVNEPPDLMRGVHIAYWTCPTSSYSIPAFPKRSAMDLQLWMDYATNRMPFQVDCYIWDKSKDTIEEGLHFRFHMMNTVINDVSRTDPNVEIGRGFALTFPVQWGYHNTITSVASQQLFEEFNKRPGAVDTAASTVFQVSGLLLPPREEIFRLTGGFTFLVALGGTYGVPLPLASTTIDYNNFIAAGTITVESPANIWTAMPQYWGTSYNVSWKLIR